MITVAGYESFDGTTLFPFARYPKYGSRPPNGGARRCSPIWKNKATALLGHSNSLTSLLLPSSVHNLLNSIPVTKGLGKIFLAPTMVYKSNAVWREAVVQQQIIF